MNQNDTKKVKAFYAKQNDCPSLKWTRDANRVQRAVCIREGNEGGACKYSKCPKVNSNKQS